MEKILLQIRKNAKYLILLALLPACNDYLNLAPENDLIKEKFWSKTEDVNSALAATYDAFRGAALESFIWGELRADMAKIGSGTLFGDYQKIARSDINPTNPAISWENYYKAINLANTLMFYDQLVLDKDKTFTLEMKNFADAEALFIRSLSYFYLIRLWNEVPLVLEPSISDTSNLYPAKSSESVVIKQILSDLSIAKDMAYTTEFMNNPPYFKGRANKFSIMALMADVYLWNQQYDKCIDYCDSIINTGLFGLEPYSNWFSLYNPGNSLTESIFEIQFDDNYENQQNPINDLLIPISGSKQVSMTTQYYTLFSESDIRTCMNRTPTWKYIGVDMEGLLPRTANSRDANMIYYRYADILLMKADALTELGRLVEANALVRQTLERAGQTHIEVTDQEEMRKVILDEHAREFILEGKRWFDLLRAAKRDHFKNKQLIINMIISGADIKQQAILKTKVYDTMSYYLPIPESDILYNQNLVQNPFYDR
jgi:starch-binding outer membrane protein, SusD/RagB family